MSGTGRSRWPEFRHWSTGGGMAVVGVHLPAQPLACATLSIHRGAASDPTGVAGLARLVASVGTALMIPRGAHVELERLGASLSVCAGWDAVRWSIEAIPERLEEAVRLALAMTWLGEVRPAVARAIRQRHDSIQLRWDRPGGAARPVFDAAAFSGRFALGIDGTPTTNAAINPEHAIAFQDGLLSGPLSLTVAGDLTRLDIGAVATAVPSVPSTRTGPLHAPAARPSASQGHPLLLVVDRPGMAQCVILAGHAVSNRRSADYATLVLLTTAWGSMHTSRLNLALREQRGGTYGASAGLHQTHGSGLLTARTIVGGARATTTVRTVFSEFTALADGGLGAAELTMARSTSMGALAVNLQTAGALSQAVSTLLECGLPPDDLLLRHRELSTSDLATVNDNCRALLRPDRLVIVVETDARHLDLPNLTAAGLICRRSSIAADEPRRTRRAFRTEVAT